MVYRVDIRGRMVQRYDGSIDTDWEQLDGRLFASEAAAILAVTEMLALRLPKHTHSSMLHNGLEITPTVYRAPESIWIVPVYVEGER